MRAFLGVPVPEALKEKIIQVQGMLSGFDVKFVETNNFHFNLKFFGELDEAKIPALKAAIDAACRDIRPFEIKIAGTGAFPNSNYIRVLWLGVKDGKEELVSLGEKVQRSVESLGYGAEERFVPHLTLDRVRSNRDNAAIASVMEKLKDSEIGVMKVDRLVLFRSVLGANGPIYEEVFAINLPIRV
jgi:RNA 2',3'-cyclic 3'-phosphodiesterase